MYARLDSAVTTQGVLLAESQSKTVEAPRGRHPRQAPRQGRRPRRRGPGRRPPRRDPGPRPARPDRGAAPRLGLRHLAARGRGGRTPPPSTPATAPRAATPPQIAAQTALFAARQRAHAAQVASLRRQIDQLRAQVVASDAQAASAERQLASWTEERALNAKLVDTGATPRQKLLEIDRTIASLEGERDAQRGMAAAATESIARAEKDIETLDQQRLVEIGQSLAEARRQVESARQPDRRRPRTSLERSELRAPQAGVVVHIYIVTPRRRRAVRPAGHGHRPRRATRSSSRPACRPRRSTPSMSAARPRSG